MKANNIFFLLLLIGLAGCGVVPAPETVKIDQPLNFDPAYFIIGALYEYAGYEINWSEDRIDIFPGRLRDEADLFKEYLKHLTVKENIKTEIRSKEGVKGQVSFFSQELKDFIVSIYPDVAVKKHFQARKAEMQSNTGSWIHVSPAMLKDQNSKLSFLAGVYLRFKAGDNLVFANSGRKANLVKDLLIEMGCQIVNFKISPRGHYPAILTLSFIPSQKIKTVMEEVEREKGFLKSKEQI